MQLANQREIPDEQISPSIRAALIDSLFETPRPVHVGIVMLAIAASMTALKTGENIIWGCVALLILAGLVRVFDWRRYQERKPTLTASEATQWQMRYQVGAMLQASAIGIWGCVTFLSSHDAVAHMIALSVITGVVSGGAGRAYGRQWIFQLQAVLVFCPIVIALALCGTPYYSPCRS